MNVQNPRYPVLMGPAALAWDGGRGRQHCHGEGCWLRCDILDIPGISAGAQRAPGKDEGHQGRKVQQEFMQGAKRKRGERDSWSKMCSDWSCQFSLLCRKSQ